MAHSFCTAVKRFSESRQSDVERSVVLRSVLVIGSALAYVLFPGMCHSSTRPGMPLHVTQFTRPSPTLVLQATNAGVRRPGYEATLVPVEST